MTTRTDHVQPHLFDPPPRSVPTIIVRLDVHLEGPANRHQCWVTVRDPSGDGVLACWSTPAEMLLAAPDSAAEILRDAIRTAMKDLAPF